VHDNLRFHQSSLLAFPFKILELIKLKGGVVKKIIRWAHEKESLGRVITGIYTTCFSILYT
jgi:hypothetical protein